DAADATGVPLMGSPFQRGVLSCTGSEFCKLAITETKMFSIHLAHELEERLPGFNESLKLYVTGCPNSCGHHWIADVGLQGVQVTRDGAQVDGFDFFIGGGLGTNATLAHRVAFRAPADEVADALERLFVAFVESRVGDERFRVWAARVGDGAVKRILAVGAA